jgi:hypothetical protein
MRVLDPDPGGHEIFQSSYVKPFFRLTKRDHRQQKEIARSQRRSRAAKRDTLTCIHKWITDSQKRSRSPKDITGSKEGSQEARRDHRQPKEITGSH